SPSFAALAARGLWRHPGDLKLIAATIWATLAAEMSLAEPSARRRLAAILAADVAGYSRLMESDEEGTLRRLQAYRREVIDPKIPEHQGRIVKTTGDGILAEFRSVVDACCAVEMQRGIGEREADVPQGRELRFRIGINVGDIIVD